MEDEHRDFNRSFMNPEFQHKSFSGVKRLWKEVEEAPGLPKKCAKMQDLEPVLSCEGRGTSYTLHIDDSQASSMPIDLNIDSCTPVSQRPLQMVLMDDKAQPGPTQTDSGTIGLLHKSECFLRKHDLGSCYEYALKAQESHPSRLPGAGQLLAIVAILRTTRSTKRPDWYEILSLPSSNVEQHVVEKRFNLLKGLLNPAENPYPYAAEALEWVLRAGSVLCDPIRRAYFDRNGKNRDDVVFIEISDDENDSKDGGTFGKDDAEIDQVEKEGVPSKKRTKNEGVEEENDSGTLVMKRRKKMVSLRGTDKVIEQEGEEYWYVVY